MSMQEPTTAIESAAPTPREPDVAPRALARIQDLLHKQRLVEQVTERQHHAEDDQRHELVAQLTHRQHEAEMRQVLDELHPADIAYILEALPLQERLQVWDLVRQDREGDILLEVSDAVRETLIATMDRDELVDAVENLDADEIADLAPDLPHEVIEEIGRAHV